MLNLPDNCSVNSFDSWRSPGRHSSSKRAPRGNNSIYMLRNQASAIIIKSKEEIIYRSLPCACRFAVSDLSTWFSKINLAFKELSGWYLYCRVTWNRTSTHRCFGSITSPTWSHWTTPWRSHKQREKRRHQRQGRAQTWRLRIQFYINILYIIFIHCSVALIH